MQSITSHIEIKFKQNYACTLYVLNYVLWKYTNLFATILCDFRKLIAVNMQIFPLKLL